MKTFELYNRLCHRDHETRFVSESDWLANATPAQRLELVECCAADVRSRLNADSRQFAALAHLASEARKGAALP